VYFGGNVVFRATTSEERGARSAPTTTNDRKLQSAEGGSSRTPPPRYHGTVISIGESRSRRVIWAGTDDGNLQVTRDGGASWRT
jgi:hypothetical protein